jgi:hypothetical protein
VAGDVSVDAGIVGTASSVRSHDDARISNVATASVRARLAIGTRTPTVAGWPSRSISVCFTVDVFTLFIPMATPLATSTVADPQPPQ